MRAHDTPRWPAALGRVAATALGAVLLLAAYAKAIDPLAFASQLRDLLPLPAALAHSLAVTIIAGEAALGTALVSGWRRPSVLLLTNAAFLLFLGIVLWQWWHPGTAGMSCGCFGALLERTPAQAVGEDLAFVCLSGLAWLGRPQAPTTSQTGRILLTCLGFAAGLALAIAAPALPLDDHATALAPGVTIAATHLDEIIPALRNGRHLVVLLDRGDSNSAADVARLNQGLQLPTGRTPVWGIADDDPALAAAFLWSAGPAFEIRSAPARMLRTLYRTLPRTALIDAGHVVQTWSGLPPDIALDTLARGDLP